MPLLLRKRVQLRCADSAWARSWRGRPALRRSPGSGAAHATKATTGGRP